jgi:hypothetical protein
MGRRFLAATGCGLALALGACGGDKKDASTAVAPLPTTPVVVPTPPTFDPAAVESEYKGEVVRIISEIAATIGELPASTTQGTSEARLAQAADSYASASTELDTAAERLQSVSAPPAFAARHRRLIAAVRRLGGDMLRASTAARSRDVKDLDAAVDAFTANSKTMLAAAKALED